MTFSCRRSVFERTAYHSATTWVHEHKRVERGLGGKHRPSPYLDLVSITANQIEGHNGCSPSKDLVDRGMRTLTQKNQ